MDATTEELLDQKRRPSFPISLMVFGIASAAAIYFSSQGDYATASAIALLGVAMRSGYRAGAATLVGLFVGASLAMFTAVPIGTLLEPLFENGFGTQGLTNRLASVATVGLSVILVTTLVVRHVVRRLLRDRPRAQSCNRWAGLACGGIQGGLLLLIAAGGLIMIEPLARDELLARGPADRGLSRRVSEQVVMAAETTRAGRLGPLVAAYNPFDHFGPLKSLHHGVEVLRSPDSLTAVAEHPEVEALCQRPAYRQTIDQLGADPELREVLASGEPITQQTLSSLMKNPAILRLLDDREFVRDLTRVLGDIDPRALMNSTSPR